MNPTPPQPENDLLDGAIRGDEACLTELLRRHGPRVRDTLAGSIPRRFQSVLSADDVMQQAYVDAFRAIGQFVRRDDGSFGGWLATLAKRNLVDALRGLEADKRGGKRHRVSSDDDGSLELYEMLGASVTTPSRHAARAEAKVFLAGAMKALPDDYRKVIQLYDIEGRAIDEVSAELKKTPGAVYMLRSRAHRRLAEILGSPSRFVSGS